MSFQSKPYEPLPGSIAQRAIALLRARNGDHPPLHTAELAEALGVDAATLPQSLTAPRRAGVLIAVANADLPGAPLQWRLATGPFPPRATLPDAVDDVQQTVRPATECPPPTLAQPPWPFVGAPTADDGAETSADQTGTDAVDQRGITQVWPEEARRHLERVSVANAISAASAQLQRDSLSDIYQSQKQSPLRVAIWDDGCVQLAWGKHVFAELTREEALLLRRQLFAVRADPGEGAPT